MSKVRITGRATCLDDKVLFIAADDAPRNRLEARLLQERLKHEQLLAKQKAKEK